MKSLLVGMLVATETNQRRARPRLRSNRALRRWKVAGFAQI